MPYDGGYKRGQSEFDIRIRMNKKKSPALQLQLIVDGCEHAAIVMAL